MENARDNTTCSHDTVMFTDYDAKEEKKNHFPFRYSSVIVALILNSERRQRTNKHTHALSLSHGKSDGNLMFSVDAIPTHQTTHSVMRIATRIFSIPKNLC